SEKVVFPEFFRDNPDWEGAEYQTECGIYQPACGLDHVQRSWGHDECLYHVVRDYLPVETLGTSRDHSFYPPHRDGAYVHLMNDNDHRQMEWVRAFNPCDLYSKGQEPPDIATLRPYYEDLITEFFPDTLAW